MRYERIGSVIERWHTADAPVVIEAAVLMKDHQTDTVFAQLKCRGIAKQALTALTVSVQPLDTDGQPLGDAVTHTYDITAKESETFGQKIPIILPDTATADMTVKAVSAVFEDGEEWTAAEDAVWASLAEEVPPAESAAEPPAPQPDEATIADEPTKRRVVPKWVVPVSVAVLITVLLGVFWKPVLYGVGSLLFAVEEYDVSAAVFGVVTDFADAEQRMVDAKTESACAFLRLYDYEGAVACLGEDHADELMRDTATASLYLIGEWYDAAGAYYFAMDDEGGVRYNLPASATATGVYSIQEGLFQREDEGGTPVPLWIFRVVSGDELRIEHRNGNIYTLYRYG